MTKPKPTRTFIILVILLLPLKIFADDEMKNGSIKLSLLKSIKKDEYVNLAKVTLLQAVEKALKEVSGKAIEAELEEEDGFLVYSVKVVSKDKKMYEFKIDAGNLDILEKESKNSFWD